MAKKLYVGNLPFSMDSERLKEVFSPYGEISEATVIAFKDTGKSKGFGFVTLEDDEQAEKAISEMNEKEVDGRKISVREAIPFDPDKPRKSFRRDGNFGGGRRFGGNGGRRSGGSYGSRRFEGRRFDNNDSENNDQEYHGGE